MQHIYKIVGLFAVCCITFGFNVNRQQQDQPDFRWGNACYYNMQTGSSISFNDKTVRLVWLKNNTGCMEVNGKQVILKVARLELPVIVKGLRIFIADSKPVKSITTDPKVHGALREDALICISDASKPLLPQGQYIFPIGRADGYQWLHEENSHLFAYLGAANWIAPGYFRSHEGIDFNMHDARGLKKHPILAIEDGTVSWMLDKNLDKDNKEACVLLNSMSQSDIYYIYKHLNAEYVFVKDGERVHKGDTIGYIWGDQTWGHLHLGVVSRKHVPEYASRYDTTLNFFPQMSELWYGNIKPPDKVWKNGDWKFNEHYATSRNIRRLNGYAGINGYGWLLGDWCTADMVEGISSPDFTTGNARLRKTLHQNSLAQAVNPNDYFDFEIHVENGVYRVQTCMGDAEEKTGQQLFFEETSVGIFSLKAGEFRWTDSKQVKVTDEKLTIRIRLKDPVTCAGIAELKFFRESL